MLIMNPYRFSKKLLSDPNISHYPNWKLIKFIDLPCLFMYRVLIHGAYKVFFSWEKVEGENGKAFKDIVECEML